MSYLGLSSVKGGGTMVVWIIDNLRDNNATSLASTTYKNNQASVTYQRANETASITKETTMNKCALCYHDGQYVRKKRVRMHARMQKEQNEEKQHNTRSHRKNAERCKE
jgi:hypothetical protein